MRSSNGDLEIHIALDYPTMEPLKLTIEGMSCEHCVRAVKNRLTATPGVTVDEVAIGSARLQYDPTRTNVDEIEDVIADEGYTAFVAD
jgi:copper chaperone